MDDAAFGNFSHLFSAHFNNHYDPATAGPSHNIIYDIWSNPYNNSFNNYNVHNIVIIVFPVSHITITMLLQS